MVDHLLLLDGRGEQAFFVSQFFSSSSSEVATTSLELLLQFLLVASGVGEKTGQGGVVLGKSDSSFRQQDEEDGLEEVPKTANSSHEPVGAEGGVSIHHTFGDVCLMRREERSSERGAHTYQPFLQAVPAPQPMASHQSCCSTRCGL